MGAINTEFGRAQHKQLMIEFLNFLNSRSKNFVLKGGTCLFLHYGLQRFSEDIDLDDLTRHTDLVPIVDTFCKLNKLVSFYRVAKNTDTVQRCIVHYFTQEAGTAPKEATLKIEVSKRGGHADSVVAHNGHLVYNIDRMCHLKANAFLGRDRLRDIYDVLFIYTNFKSVLSSMTADVLRSALVSKDVDVVLATLEFQKDSLIDNKALEDTYLRVCMELGINF